MLVYTGAFECHITPTYVNRVYGYRTYSSMMVLIVWHSPCFLSMYNALRIFDGRTVGSKLSRDQPHINIIRPNLHASPHVRLVVACKRLVVLVTIVVRPPLGLFWF